MMNEYVAVAAMEEAEARAVAADAAFDALVESLPTTPVGHRADSLLPSERVFTFEELIAFGSAAKDGRPE